MRVGATIGGRYRLESEIGAGPFSRVFLASDNKSPAMVALKIFTAGLAVGESRDRILENIAIAARFENRGAVAILDRGFDEAVFAALEYCPGGTLADEIEACEGLAPERAAAIAVEACRTLEAAHAIGLLHLGLKPENLLFDRDGSLKIGDFGLDRAISQSDETLPIGRTLAGARYLAPEQVGGGRLTPATDVYALGLVLAEAVAGRAIVRTGGRLMTLGSGSYRPGSHFQCNSDLREVIDRATAVNPAERYRSPSEMAADLLVFAGLVSSPVEAESSESADLATGREVTTAPLAADEPVGRHSVRSDGAAKSTVTAASAVGLLERPPRQPAFDPTFEHPTETSTISEESWPAPRRGFGGVDITEVERVDDDLADDADEVWPDGDLLDSRTVDHGKSPRRWRRRIWLITTAILVSAALVATGLYFAGSRTPDLLGLQIDAAKARAASESVGTEVVAVEADDLFAAGTVIAQSPAPSQRIRLNEKMKLTVSSGPPPVRVDDVTGKPLAEAASTLRATGLSPLVTAIRFENSPVGQVLAQEPPNGKADRFSPVQLTVSAGPAPAQIPDLAGKAKNDAESALREIGFDFTERQDYNETVRSGAVISVSPDPGTKARLGYPVTLVLSKGPQTFALPDLRGKRVTDASSALQSMGMIVKLVQIVGQDKVVAMSPAPGAQVKKGTTVTLTTGP